MNNPQNLLPHLDIKLVQQGTAKPPSGFPRTSDRSQDNKNNRSKHSEKLTSSLIDITSDWKEEIKRRKEENKPELPQEKSLILQIDPDSFNPDDLKKFGIEVIAELENGFIIGASSDIDMSDLTTKIEKFLKEERGGAKVAEIWEFLDNVTKPQYILSPELLEKWQEVNDDIIYTVDVGIGCLGSQAQLPNFPIKKDGESIDRYSEKVREWIGERDMTYQQWDELKIRREEEFEKFILAYQGEIINNRDGEGIGAAELPDSFTCRVNISGKGLKDLVFNFPYVFDVSLADKISEINLSEREYTDTSLSFELQPPDDDSPKVCIIDSGIQEQHPLLKAAIAANDSKSWVRNEANETADKVSYGGHGTRVAGAVLYPRIIPTNGQEKAICWLQNARVLDSSCSIPSNLFMPKILEEIVKFYCLRGTKIFNHSITGSVPSRNEYRKRNILL